MKKNYFKFLSKFFKRIKKVKNDLVSFIDKNYPIIAYGASTKGNIVLNYVNWTLAK